MSSIERRFRKIAREITLKWRHPDRYILERKIFPKIKNKKVLLVGVAHYTSDYPKRLGENKRNEVWTMDVDSEVRKFGAKRHITDSIANVNKHFKKEFFDIILMPGVFGYGLNTKKEGERTMFACHEVLKRGGEFIITWNNLKPKNRIIPEKLKGFKLFKRKPAYRGLSQYKTSDNKVFDFLIKE